ncbi:hypothetical protein Cde04nite_20110 [Cellulomonas denverensis]|nr:hypothetical protein Cde04nite_20110 [Cellulomonas denverensis]
MRTLARTGAAGLPSSRAADRHPGGGCPRSTESTGVLVLDLVFVLGVLALFALVGLVAVGVEKL